MKIQGVSSIYAFIRGLGTSTIPTSIEGLLGVSIEDKTGKPAMLVDGDTVYAIQTGLPVGGVNDGQFRINRLDRTGAVAQANLAPLLHEPFDGTALNALRWTAVNATYGPTVSQAGYNFNPAASALANANANIVSNNKFLKTQRNPFYNKWRARWSKIALCQGEFGFGIPSGIAVVPNGVFWRLVGNQAFGVITINSTEITSNAIDISTIVDANNFYTYDIFIDDDQADFTIHDTGGNLIFRTFVRLPNVQYRLFSVSRLPMFSRLFTGASAPAGAPLFILSDIFLGVSDTDNNRSYDDFLSANALAAYSNPLTGVQAIQYTNSAEPANAVLSNTAASYGTLGGKFQFAAPAGAATDYLLFAFQVPDPVTFKLKGVKVSCKSVGAAVTTSATELEWFVVTNMSTASLASAGAIRIPIGLETFLISTALVSPVSDSIADFTPMPIRCDPGKFIGFGVRVPGGAATTSQVIKGIITPFGTFE